MFDNSKIVVGSIIWAKRYKTKKEKLAIRENHREGPYIVVKNKMSLVVQVVSQNLIENKYIILVELINILQKILI